MTKKYIFLGVVILFALGVWGLSMSWHYFFATNSTAIKPLSEGAPNSKALYTAPEKSRKEMIEKITSILSAPISFYGKAIDQNGDPVPDARVGYSALDKFMEEGTSYEGVTDQNGLFEIEGINGARLSVNVRKEGYYFIDGKSNAAFAYGTGSDGYFKAPPTKENPTIFILQKKGDTVPLIYNGTGYYKPKKTGEPLEIILGSGGQAGAGHGDIRFERWVSDQEANSKGLFDWRFLITAPSGGIIEYKDKYSFEAPLDGYQKSIEINMPASLGDDWKYGVERRYFIKMRNGRYARINVTIQAGHNNTPLIVDAFVNPAPGNRNLEFDSNKVLKNP